MASSGSSDRAPRRWPVVSAFVGGVAAASIAGWIVENRAPERAARPSDSRDRPFERHLTSLERRMLALEARPPVDPPRPTQPSPMAAPATATSVEPGQSPPDLTPEDDREIEEERIDRRVRFLEGAMRAEAVDRAWAADATAAIQDAVTRPLYTGTTLTSVDCRSTMCSLALEHEDFEASDRFMAHFAQEVPSLPRAMIRRFPTQSGRMGSVAFFAREGHNLPRFVDE